MHYTASENIIGSPKVRNKSYKYCYSNYMDLSKLLPIIHLFFSLPTLLFQLVANALV